VAGSSVNATANPLQLYLIAGASGGTHQQSPAELESAARSTATAAAVLTSLASASKASARSNPGPDRNTAFTSTSDRRRATHNEVERRRRDTINSWIMKLGKLIPDLMSGPGGGDQPNRATLMSKGGILARACDYLAELRQENHELSRRAARLEALEAENERLKGRLKALHEENTSLRTQLMDYPEDEEDEEEEEGVVHEEDEDAIQQQDPAKSEKTLS